MTFEEFRKDIENKFNSITEIELQEYHYEPHSFGNGILAYRIKGLNHKFVYDGRENELTWFVSKPHQKYFGANFQEILKRDGLQLSSKELKTQIENSAQQNL